MPPSTPDPTFARPRERLQWPVGLNRTMLRTMSSAGVHRLLAFYGVVPAMTAIERKNQAAKCIGTKIL